MTQPLLREVGSSERQSACFSDPGRIKPLVYSCDPMDFLFVAFPVSSGLPSKQGHAPESLSQALLWGETQNKTVNNFFFLIEFLLSLLNVLIHFYSFGVSIKVYSSKKM